MHKLTCADAIVDRVAPISGRAFVAVSVSGVSQAWLYAAVLRIACAVTIALTHWTVGK